MHPDGDLCGAKGIVGCKGGFVGCYWDLWGASGGGLVWCRRDLSGSSSESEPSLTAKCL